MARGSGEQLAAHSYLLYSSLLASGVGGEGELRCYLSLWQRLWEQVVPHIPEGNERDRARALFSWLWQAKPKRYRLGGSFRLTQVVEVQLDPHREEVGNCLGLTLLYNILAQGLGLGVGAIYLEEAFGHGPHVLSRLYSQAGPLDIENILPSGFGYEGHLHQPRQEWGDRELVAEIYLSRGNELFEQKRWIEAIALYDTALELNPRSEKARLNRLMAQGEGTTSHPPSPSLLQRGEGDK